MKFFGKRKNKFYELVKDRLPQSKEKETLLGIIEKDNIKDYSELLIYFITTIQEDLLTFVKKNRTCFIEKKIIINEEKKLFNKAKEKLKLSAEVIPKLNNYEFIAWVCKHNLIGNMQCKIVDISNECRLDINEKNKIVGFTKIDRKINLVLPIGEFQTGRYYIEAEVLLNIRGKIKKNQVFSGHIIAESKKFEFQIVDLD